MKLLLIVGTANDVFISNMVKWLKANIDITIDIFEFYPSDSQKYGKLDCNHIESVIHYTRLNNNKFYRFFISQFFASRVLTAFLKTRHYDIIHCHWIVPPLVITPGIKSHCRKLFVTFWGGELSNALRILHSSKLYYWNLKKFLKDVDYIINSKTFKSTLSEKFPQLVEKHIEGYLGSAPLELIYIMMEHESKESSKKKLLIDSSKISVMIGYSGKAIHQHIPIINELTKRDCLKSKLHLLVPMTRGADKQYCKVVENLLENSGYSYTLFKNQFLSDEDIAQLRIATDITLQLSKFDGFSRSIVECLCAKSILIYGDWLNYEDYLCNNNFIAHSAVSISKAIDKLFEIAQDIKCYNSEVNQNSINGKEKNIWSVCIKDWINAYNNY